MTIHEMHVYSVVACQSHVASHKGRSLEELDRRMVQEHMLSALHSSDRWVVVRAEL